MPEKYADKIHVTRSALGFALTAFAALAQADIATLPSTVDSAKDSPELTEIVVTANKREESINKVGLTIQAIGTGDLQQRNLQSLQVRSVGRNPVVFRAGRKLDMFAQQVEDAAILAARVVARRAFSPVR